MTKSKSDKGKLKQALRDNLKKRKVQSRNLKAGNSVSLKLRTREISAEPGVKPAGPAADPDDESNSGPN